MKTPSGHFVIARILPPAGLYGAVIARIQSARARSARRRFAVAGVSAALSGLLLIPALQYAAYEFISSGFYDYALLLLSPAALSYWKEILLTLAESLPSLAVLLLLALGGTLVRSLIGVLRNARSAFIAPYAKA